MTLSELLHGRTLVSASAWDADCLRSEPDEDALEGFGLVMSALRLSVTHLRKMLFAAAQVVGDGATMGLLSAEMDEFSEAVRPTSFARVEPIQGLPLPTVNVIPSVAYLAPLLPNEGLSERAIAALEEAADAFEGVMKRQRPAGRLYRDDEIATTAFGWHRLRSARIAQASLDREVKLFASEDAALLGLSRRASAWILVGEAAALLGGWLTPGPSRDATLLLASSLRSAWWLWLEDDDRAMAALRTVLEQVCRLRAWRLKPAKAATMEGRATPRDWIEACGWRRLGPLNRALGEFSHVSARSDWSAARDLLTRIQTDSDPEYAPLTARRAAAELVTEFVAFEVLEQMADVAEGTRSAIATIFAEVGVLDDDWETRIDERLAHVWNHRSSRPADA
jgi:hypothetical protein